MINHTRVPRYQLPPRARVVGQEWTANGFVFRTIRVDRRYVIARAVRRIPTQ